MSTGGPPSGGAPQDPVQWGVGGLVAADFRRFAADDDRFVAAAREPGFVRLMRLFVTTAGGQMCLARGELREAVRFFHVAASMLPPLLQRPLGDDELRRAALPPPPSGRRVRLTEEEACIGTARVLWREWFELDDLRARVAGMSAQEILLEACIEQLTWTLCDPHHHARLVSGRLEASGGTSSRRDRTSMCERATRLRQFARPEAGTISPSVWRAVGGEDGLVAAALDLLGSRPASVPWWDASRQHILPPVRPGRRLAWEFAQALRNGR
jgi:hypothetical protein